ncbi:single-stranded-DNA-specific exonuclease RecJ [Streptococcus halichoeri]|uniref:single-stranded-DNA-specific exonuclease RecJ n=1 Tax=Streptococcus halichoeri TaxID=254785 RepID=UPI001357909A|nr:single-stranded-DNA-specific exonuclease RecJ [Streptococcus halichoeri]
MITATYQWALAKEKPDAGFFKLAKNQGLSQAAAQLVYQRGIRTAEDLTAFLTADLADLHDPYLLHDMAKAVPRIRQAIEQAETILVYGDYDADGMTSASIVQETLEMLGAQVRTYLPNRFSDGYGPNQSVYKYFIEQEDVSLIITVDNGVAGHEAIAYAQAQGVDVIVTDHHSLPEALPKAFAIIHPEHPDADYPFHYLAGCGVAFKLACALLESIPTEFLDLVAIGTIADMVSLTGENRILVKNGLAVLRQTERIGLQELMQLADVKPGDCDEETIGFQIAPALNALGRLDDPNPALELLTGFDEEETHQIALMIHAKNQERKELVQAIYQEALEMVDLAQPIQVLAKKGWHPGVLGIVAGRIMEEIGRPVIVLGISDDELAKGSARSPERINIYQALAAAKEHLLAFGGHAGAAGMTIEAAELPLLRQALADYVANKHLAIDQKSQLSLDDELDLKQLSLATLKELSVLAPFGMDNKKPLFWLRDFQVLQARSMGQNNRHLKLKIAKDGVEIDVVAFQKGSLWQEFQQARGLELAVTLSVNQWNGHTSIQLFLVDARVSGIQLIDVRKRNAVIPKHLPSLAEAKDGQAALLELIPDEPKQLRQQFAQKHLTAIYFKNKIEQPLYLSGYGSKEQFAKLYKTLYQFPEFDIRYKLLDLASYLNLDQQLLTKMIQIFEELGFVNIADGVMTVIKDAPKKDLTESLIYQNLKAKVAYQELMALGSPQAIYDWLRAADEPNSRYGDK